jgi:hypothetical protein
MSNWPARRDTGRRNTSGGLAKNGPDCLMANYGPFKDFCPFHADAEQAAILCYDRPDPRITQAPGRDLQDRFVCARDHEDGHARIFETINAGRAFGFLLADKRSWPRRLA